MKFTLFPEKIPVDQVFAVARAADRSGYDAIALSDSVFYPEHVSVRYPYSEDGLRHWQGETHFVDPFVTFPAIAACTENLRFFTAVLKAPLRQPLLLAKSLGTAASLFPGRIGLGVGTSWMPEEFKWLSEEMKTRGARLDEMIEILRLCLSPGWTEFHGKYYDFDRLMMSPVPEQPVPIYVGGHAAPALRRAAILGDGWISAGADIEEMKTVIPHLLEIHRDSPRAAQKFEIIACVMDAPSLDRIRTLEDLGVTNLAVQPYSADATCGEEKCRSILEFSEKIILKHYSDL